MKVGLLRLGALLSGLALTVIVPLRAAAQSVVTVGGQASEIAVATRVPLPQPVVAIAGPGGSVTMICDDRRVRTVAADGLVTVVAGTGGIQPGDDGAPATTSGFNYPRSLAYDPDGNLVIAHTFVALVQRLEPGTGLLRRIAGLGAYQSGYTGDGGPATAARLGDVVSIAYDGGGNLHILEGRNHVVRRVDASTGVIRTIAGNGRAGFSGDGGPATAATLNVSGGTGGLAFDPAGNLYVLDSGNARIRRVDPRTGVITTVAGNGTPGFSGDGGPATQASIRPPYSGGQAIAIDARGVLYLAEGPNDRIRRVDLASGVISTAAGGSTSAFTDSGPVPAVAIRNPAGVAVDASGHLLVADTDHSVVRRVDLGSGQVGTVAGVGPRPATGDGGIATAAPFSVPQDLVVDRAGNLTFTDKFDRKVRRIDGVTGRVTTIAGTGVAGCASDGSSFQGLYLPQGLAVDAQGNAYFGDCSKVFRVDAATSTLTHLAGNGDGGPSAAGDGGPAKLAAIGTPNSLALDGAGGLLVLNGWGRTFRVDLATGTIRTIAGAEQSKPEPADGAPATSGPLYAEGLALDASGNLYLAGVNKVRRVSTAGIVTTIAGTGSRGFSGDGGPGTLARLTDPLALAFDPTDTSGAVLVSDTGNSRVRRIGADGRITTVAGNGRPGFSGDGLPATAAALSYPFGIAVDARGALFAAAPSEGRIRAVFPCGAAAAPAVTTPSGSAVPAASVTLTFRPSPGAFSYDVLLDTVNPPRQVVAAGLLPSTASPYWMDPSATVSYAAGSLQPGTTYFWQVVARGDAQCPASEAKSGVASFTTTGTCSEPAAFQQTEPADLATVSGSTVTLGWTAASGAASYDLYLSTSTTPVLYRAGLTGTSLAVPDLSPSTPYSWFVTAAAACDRTKTVSTAVRRFSTSGACPPLGAPTVASPAAGTSGVPASTTLSWNAGSGSTTSDLYLGRSNPPPLHREGVTGASLSVTGLVRGATYFWKVESRQACGEGRRASAVETFTVAGACAAPPAPVWAFVPPGAVGSGQTYVVTFTPASLEAGGAFLVERSTSATFATVLDSQVVSSPAASFVAVDPGTLHHRVRAVAGCDPTLLSAPSEARAVAIDAGRPSVVFTRPPRALVTPLSATLDEGLASADPAQDGRIFTIQNVSPARVTAFVAMNTIAPSPNFFQVDDLSGQAGGLGLALEPGEIRRLRLRYTGVAGDTAASYQGIVYLFVAEQKIVPYAFVNLKVGGGAVGAPRIQVAGKDVELAAFPGWAASRDDVSRPPLVVDVVNPGSGPLEVAAEIGPEVWLEPEAGWNQTPIAAGSSRSLRLFTRRQRALAGSAFPRYTYLTLRTRDGATARLLVQDSDLVTTGGAPRGLLPDGVPSSIVPSVVNATAATGSTFVSRVRISNAGTVSVPATLVFTPRAADGLDQAAVRQAQVTIPPQDVVSLSDPLVSVFGLTPPVSGALEVRAPAETAGLLTVTSVVDAAAPSGGTFGFQLPTLARGDGATLASPQAVTGVTLTPAYRTNLILVETTGRDGASARVTLADAEGTTLGTQTVSVPRYGQTQISLAPLLGSAARVDAGRVDLTVESGGGAVAGVITVIDNGNDDAVTYASRPASEAATVSSTAFARALGARTGVPRWAKAAGTIKLVIPSAVNGFETFPGKGLPYTFRSLMGFASGTSSPATFRLTYQDLTSGLSHTATVTVKGRGSREYPNALEELFGLAPGQRSQGPIFVEADPNGVVTCKVYSPLETGTLGDSFPVVTVPSAVLTGGGSPKPLALDGLEHSTDAARGSRSNLILNEVQGEDVTVTISLYEAGNRSRPIAETDVSLKALQKIQLSSVFTGLGLDTAERKKDRANVLCVVRAKSGRGLVSAIMTTIDNKTGDTKNALLTPGGGPAPTIGF